MPSCPALFIAAPSSGQGKTTVVAALARLHVRQGRKVCVFKCGPDFLDPQIHAAATGVPCYNLDLGMCGEADARYRLAKAAQEFDLILVEGVMGLFDGEPSAADLAIRFGLPVLAVIDARAMAQTFGAVAHGLATYRPELPFGGVLANRVASAGHAQMLRESLPDGMRWYGAVMRDEDAAFPERHLGLMQAEEISDLQLRLDAMADKLAETGAADLPPPVEFPVAPAPWQAEGYPTQGLQGVRIAIARDAAFGFIYPANADCLQELGAELRYFSPLAGEALPESDALWFPGGYPELHAEQLSQQRALWQAVGAHVAAGKPALAECGGMMALFERVTDKQGQTFPMAGVLPGETVMQQKLAALGMQSITLPEGDLTGHTFHYSKCTTALQPLCHAISQRWQKTGEPIYRQQRLTASYVHFYFPSNPQAVVKLFG